MPAVHGRRVRGASLRTSSFRVALLLGSALAAPQMAAAENVAFNGTGDYSLTRTDTVAGGPKTIDIVTNGAINLNLAGVTVANSSTNGTGIGANTTSGTGNIRIVDTSVTATGTASTYGIDARTTSGNVDIVSGTVVSNTNASSRGIYVATTTGNVSIVADSTSGNQRGIFTAFGNGTNTTTIKSNFATANGLNQPNAIVAQGGLVSVDSGTATLTGNGVNGAAIFAQGELGVSIKSVTASTQGAGQWGIDLQYSGAKGAIDSGTITTSGQNAYGIYASATTDLTIKSGTISTTGAGATGMYVEPLATGNTNSGTGVTDITSTTITTTGSGAGGITVLPGTGAVRIASDTINATGSGSNGISIESQGALSSELTITSNRINSTGTAINVEGGGTATAVKVTSASITGSGLGISVSGSGPVTVESGTIALTNTATSNVNGLGGLGISVVSLAGDTSITSRSLVYTGTGNTLGISAQQTGTGSLTIRSGDVSVIGNGGYAVLGSSQSAAINITTTGNTTTAGTTRAAGGSTAQGNQRYADGIDAISQTGAISVANSGTVSTAGVSARGIDVEAGRAILTFQTPGTVASTAALSVTNSGTVKTTGAGSNAINIRADAGNAVTVTNSGTVSTTGATSVAIAAVGGTTTSIVNSGTVSSVSGPAIQSAGATLLDNSGTITGGTGGVAVQLGTANDTVTLRTGSVVNGTIAGGGGTDRAVLNGTATVSSTSQAVAAFTGFDSLVVAGGYWTAGATPSSFNSAAINSGATLELASGTTGISGVTVPTFVDNGTLAIRSTGVAGSTLGATTVSGSGTVLFTGTGTATLNGTNNVTTTGGIAVDNGANVILTGTQGGTVTMLAGGTFQIGNGTTAGLFTGNVVDNGTLIVNHSDDYTFAGVLSGAGNLVKQGAGKLIFGTNYAFTGVTTISAGSIKLSTPVNPNSEIDLRGTGQLDFSGTQQVIAELAGAAGSSINIAGGSLAVNQATSTAFAGNLTGAGTLTKTGTGTLNLTGANSYTGATTVSGGKLAVNGSIVSPVTVTAGGRLGGTGTVANVTIGAGGRYAPGNSIGTQTANGNVVFAAGSIYEVEANADGRADRVNATGTVTIAPTATVSVLAEAGTFNRLTSYTILTGTGGVSGTFGGATSNFAFLTPSLSYSANAVTLNLLRNDITFASLAQTPNQLAVANAANALGIGNAVFNTLVGLSTAAVPNAYSQLTGEVFASTPSILIDQGKRVRGAVLDRAGVTGDGMGVWGQAMAAGIESDATGNVAGTGTERRGVVSGFDYGRDGWRLGVYAGYIDNDTGIIHRGNHADADTKLVGAYGSWSTGKIVAKIGGDYSWHNIDTTRNIAIGSINGTNTASYDATSQQVYGELSYKLIDGPVYAAPFIGGAYVRLHSDALTEAGTATALSVASRTREVEYLTGGWHVGGSAALSPTATLLPHLTASYQYGVGDLRGGSIARFGATGQAFGISGARLAQSTFGLDGGVDVQFGNSFKLGAGGFMSTSKDWSDFGATVSASFAF
jgi:fibronectin-binding autotransporter adhesin